MFKALFRSIFSMMVLLYQRTNGKIGGEMRGMPVLLLTTTGRKTGKQRTTPLGFFEHEGRYVIIASNAGFDNHPAWFHNLKSQSQVMLQIRDRHLTALAEVAEPELRQQLWAKLITLSPGYQEYQQRTRREIPMVLLRPISTN